MTYAQSNSCYIYIDIRIPPPKSYLDWKAQIYPTTHSLSKRMIYFEYFEYFDLS